VVKDARTVVHLILARMKSKMELCFVADANHANAANWLEYFATELGQALIPCDVMRSRARFLDIMAGESHDPRAAHPFLQRARVIAS
jgi:hypothetical protein